MRQFFKNILRTAWKNKASYIGAVAIISLGILIMVAMIDVMYNLQDKVDRYYSDNHFADVFAQVSAIPAEELHDLEEIEGISSVFGRLSYDARLKLDNTTEIVGVHILAYDENDAMNKMTIKSEFGRLSDDMILLGDKMQLVYHFSKGDKIKVIFGSGTEDFSFGGTVKEPEYIYAVPPSGAEMPDGEIYDIACMPKEKLEAVTGKKGIYTEIGFKLEKGYTYEDVKYILTEKLSGYGLLNISDQKNQMSNYMLKSELAQLFTMGTALPFVFMIISIFMMYIVLKKIIDRDRSLIGTMKAFGYRDSELLVSYMKQSIVLGACGSVIGSLLSVPFGQYMFNMYKEYFDLPYTEYHQFVSVRLMAFAAAIITSMSATYLGVRDILKINPAEAMRQSVPEVSGGFHIPVWLRLNSRQKIGLRSISRTKFRSFAIAISIAFPFTMIAVLSTFPGMSDRLFYDQFNKMETYDFQVSLEKPARYNNAVNAVSRIDGVYNAEGIGKYGVSVKHENITKQTMLFALCSNSKVYRIMDIHGTFYEPPKNGVILNDKFAKKLNVGVGDVIEISNPHLSKKPIKIRVVNIISESFAKGIYINIDAMPKFFTIPTQATTLVFNVEEGKEVSIKKKLSETLNVTSISDTKRILKNYESMMGNMLGTVSSFCFISVLAGIILIYNISNISVRERKNEFGTLMILGMTNREISEIIRFEQLVNFLLGLAIALPLTELFRQYMENIIAADAYTVEIIITPQSYLYALFICVLVMMVSVWSVTRTVRKIEPTDVMKERE